MYELKEPFWQFIDHWQTLIAGLLALAAGVGTVRATIKSANREIAAAQEQTKLRSTKPQLRAKSNAVALHGKGMPFTRC
jgi:hypothetical protein